MTREDAERERDRLAEEHPEATWLVTEGPDGWQVLRVGVASASGATGTTTESKPRPPTPDDPRSTAHRSNPYSF